MPLFRHLPCMGEKTVGENDLWRTGLIQKLAQSRLVSLESLYVRNRTYVLGVDSFIVVMARY
ncbi:hypothetical protein LZ30DRAFT_739429 [Colletotrichum cereale]|nr:hypothetical protein LZ30DRAFT_739429 [Colletotrichum cereale]